MRLTLILKTVRNTGAATTKGRIIHDGNSVIEEEGEAEGVRIVEGSPIAKKFTLDWQNKVRHQTAAGEKFTPPGKFGGAR